MYGECYGNFTLNFLTLLTTLLSKVVVKSWFSKGGGCNGASTNIVIELADKSRLFNVGMF
jgi:hypothetical protein